MSPYSDEEYFYKLDNMVIKSSQYLRQIFKQRWKDETGENWRDESDYIRYFCTQYYKTMLEKVIPLQKKLLLQSCSLEEWDFSLISNVILNFGDKKKYEIQNQAVRQLKDLRNELAHHKSKKLTENQYSEKVKTFTESLQILEIQKSEIEMLSKRSDVISALENTKRLKFLLKNAEKFTKSQNFENALQQYSEAMAIPRLSPNTLGDVYEKRASCHLSLKDQQNSDVKHIDQAILDVDEALKLNKKSWNAHFLKAQCLKATNSLSEAIRYYEMSLAISPVQKHVKQGLDSCKLLIWTHKLNANLNSDQLPTSPNEMNKILEAKTGRKYEVKGYSKLNALNSSPSMIGDHHYYGWDVSQDYAKAVKYYVLADEQGYPSGCYNLGLCYYHGHGVQQNMSKSMEYFKRCATMDAKKKLKFETYNQLDFNSFVAWAELDIGKCYKEGTGVEKNLNEAYKWYFKAMTHGDGSAATLVGGYANDILGNEKLAEMCWKQGLIFQSSEAAAQLWAHYSRQLEPKLALIMFEIARKMGNSKCLEMSVKEIKQNCLVLQSAVCTMEKGVLKFERKFNLEHKGMTFMERFKRMVEPLESKKANLNIGSAGQLQNISKEVMFKVAMKGYHGSKTASTVFKTIAYLYKLNNLLEIGNDFSKTYKLKVVNLLFKSMTLEDHNRSFDMVVGRDEKLENILEELFQETCQQTSDEEMKIRFCYVSVNLRSSLMSFDDLYAYEILKEGLRRYPEEYVYYRLLTYCLKLRSRYEDALRFVNETIKKFANKVDMFFYKAKLHRLSKSLDSSETITTLKSFLDKAPKDHRLVPEAYYFISFVQMEDYMKLDLEINHDDLNIETLKLIQDNYTLGKDAETDQLPCYQPYVESYLQSSVASFLSEQNNEFDFMENPINDLDFEPVQNLKGVLQRKMHIKSPVRMGLIKQHRERFRALIAINSIGAGVAVYDKILSAKLQQTRAKTVSKLICITLQETNPTEDNIFWNRILDLTIIEEPNVYTNLVQFVAEDDNGDTTRVYIDRDGSEKLNWQRFEAGCKLAIVNPYMWICVLKGTNVIRISDIKCIIFLEKVKDMCRFCGEENATRKCSKCKRLYCSRECQKLDWQVFEHKLICEVIC